MFFFFFFFRSIRRIREYLRSKESVALRFGRLALFCLVVRICVVCFLVLCSVLFVVFCMQDAHTHGQTFILKNHINQKRNGQYTISPKAFEISNYPDNYPNRYKTIIICIFYMPHISRA